MILNFFPCFSFNRFSLTGMCLNKSIFNVLDITCLKKPFLENQQLTEIYHTYQGTAFCDYTDIICDDVHGRVLNFEYWVADPFL